jgi:hypothetical protein
MEGDEMMYLEPALAAVAGSGTLAQSSVNPQDYGVPVLMAQIEAAMRQADTAAQRDFVKADFDPQDGHPYHYIHRVRGTKKRVEWFVKLTRIAINTRRKQTLRTQACTTSCATLISGKQPKHSPARRKSNAECAS